MRPCWRLVWVIRLRDCELSRVEWTFAGISVFVAFPGIWAVLWTVHASQLLLGISFSDHMSGLITRIAELHKSSTAVAWSVVSAPSSAPV